MSTTAANLAAQSGSPIDLWRVILAGALGALGAVVGDSLLYWLSRTVVRRSTGWKSQTRKSRTDRPPGKGVAIQPPGPPKAATLTHS